MVNCVLSFDYGAWSGCGHTIEGGEEKKFTSATIEAAKESALEMLKQEARELLATRDLTKESIGAETTHFVCASLLVKRPGEDEGSWFYLKRRYSNLGKVRYSGRLHQAQSEKCWHGKCGE